MRLFEIASAEEQMALLKLIMDKTWEALTTQQRQQAQQKATPKPKPAKARSPKVPYAPPPPKLAKPRVNPQAKQPVPIAQQVKPQAKVATLNKSIQAPQKASNDSKDGFVQPRVSGLENDLSGEDRHSKNSFPTSS